MKHFIVFILLVMAVLSVKSQDKWYKITKNDMLIMSAQFISGAADGLNQAIAHHKFGKGNQFWDYKISWQNKYKNGDPSQGEAFFLSTSAFVIFTDGYHSTRAVDRSFTFVSIGLSYAEIRNYKGKVWKVIAKKAVLSAIANRLTFTIIYNSL